MKKMNYLKLAALIIVSIATFSAQAQSALEFTSGNSYVDAGSDASLEMTTAFTGEAWINPTTPVATGGIIFNREGEYEIAIYPGGEIKYAIRNTNPGWVFVSTGVIVPLNTWSHITWTYSSSTGAIKIYVDGTLQYTFNGSGTIGDFPSHASQDNFYIGSRQGTSTQPFRGTIDEVRMWNAELDAATIAAWMDNEVTDCHPYYDNLQGYWKMDEGSGTTTADHSGNGNHGAITGATWTTGVTTTGAPTVDAGSNQTVYYGYTASYNEATLTATVSGGEAPYTYSWMPGGETTASITVSPASTTTYTVTVTDALGCSASDEVTVCVIDVSCGNNPKNPKVMVCHKGKTNCISANAVPAHLAHGDALGACGVSPDCTSGKTGNDLVQYEIFDETGLSIYPNPVTDNAVIQWNTVTEGKITIELFDNAGRLVQVISNEVAKADMIYEAQLKTVELTPGAYFVKMSSETDVKVLPVLVQR